jgi:hypothetical protein
MMHHSNAAFKPLTDSSITQGKLANLRDNITLLNHILKIKNSEMGKWQ